MKTENIKWVIYDDPNDTILAEGIHTIRYRSTRGRKQALRLLDKRLAKQAPDRQEPGALLWEWKVSDDDEVPPKGAAARRCSNVPYLSALTLSTRHRLTEGR